MMRESGQSSLFPRETRCSAQVGLTSTLVDDAVMLIAAAGIAAPVTRKLLIMQMDDGWSVRRSVR